jgi:hypothetical protein
MADDSQVALLTLGNDNTVKPVPDVHVVPSRCVVRHASTATALLLLGYYRDRLQVRTADSVFVTLAWGRIEALSI